MGTNILLMGSPDAGKTALANIMFDHNPDDTRQSLIRYQNDILKYCAIEIKGEEDFFRQKEILEQVSEDIEDIFKTENSETAIEVIWYCFDSAGKEFSEENVRQLLTVSRIFLDVPVMVILTKSYCPIEERAQNEDLVEEVLEKYDTGKKIRLCDVISVNSVPFKTTNDEIITVFGIDDLINKMNEILPEAKRAGKSNLILGKQRLRKKQANVTAETCAKWAVAMGTGSFGLSDSQIPSDIWKEIIKAIAQIYGVEASVMTEVLMKAVAAFIVSKTVLSIIEEIPRLNIRGFILEGLVTGVFTTALGMTAICTCEKIVAEELKSNDLEGIKEFAAEKFLAAVTEISLKWKEGLRTKGGRRPDAEKMIADYFKD